jgi:succinate dehydrogenase / fumarate reductase cytochrome b subunit
VKSPLREAAASSVGRKILTGVTGLGLTLFVLIHMLGNLLAFSPDETAYNAYSHKIISLGLIFYAIEIGLLAFVLVHIVLGVSIYLRKKIARPVDYSSYKSAGGASRQTISSRSMIVTGVVLGGFLVIHLLSFKYGPGISEGYVTTVQGEEIRDLRRLLFEKFQHPEYALGYPAVMILLGVHLRHGIWSALQSLGAMKPGWSPFIYTAGALIGALIALGFLILPLWIYFGGGA